MEQREGSGSGHDKADKVRDGAAGIFDIKRLPFRRTMKYIGLGTSNTSSLHKTYLQYLQNKK